jgi:4-hydroxy-tetrahydrodipicolinate reductase
MLRLCLVGGLGRMGKAIASLAEVASDVAVTSVWESDEAIRRSGDFARSTGYAKNAVAVGVDGRAAARGADVVIDFSLPEALSEVVRVCEELKKPLVTGTTGVPDTPARLVSLARKVAVVGSPNMATGANAVLHLCDVAARKIGSISDIEIVETHHRAKRDKPSGTALELARVVSAATGTQVPTHSLRVGDVPGRHTIVFALKGETIEITHNALSRDCFAAGALLAARFVARARPGLYTMLDVIGSGKPEVQAS